MTARDPVNENQSRDQDRRLSEEKLNALRNKLSDTYSHPNSRYLGYAEQYEGAIDTQGEIAMFRDGGMYKVICIYSVQHDGKDDWAHKVYEGNCLKAIFDQISKTTLYRHAIGTLMAKLRVYLTCDNVYTSERVASIVGVKIGTDAGYTLYQTISGTYVMDCGRKDKLVMVEALPQFDPDVYDIACRIINSVNWENMVVELID